MKSMTNSLEFRWGDVGVMCVIIVLLAGVLVVQARARSDLAAPARAESVPEASAATPAGHP